MPNPSVLLANEAGGGRGHVTLLAGVARALGPGLTLHAAIPGLGHASDLPQIKVERGPLLRYAAVAQDGSLAGNASWGDYLAACGLTSPEIVRAHLRWWRRKIVETDASILVADYAPLALWAAQGLKAEGWEMTVLSVGTGYGLPPARLERFPQLLPDYSRRSVSEADILSVLNEVAASEGLQPLPALPAIARADCELAFTFAHLDPYADWRDKHERFAPVLSPPAPLVPERGTELFIYFGRGELDDPALLDAVAGLPLPRRGFFPGASTDVLDRLRQSGVVVEGTPLPMSEIAARARLVLNAGQHGMQCLAALSGLPQVAVPQHLEQMYHCRRSEAQGGLRHVPFDGRSAKRIADVVLDAWSDRSLQDAALSTARDLRAGYPDDPAASLAARLAPIVDRARSALG